MKGKKKNSKRPPPNQINESGYKKADEEKRFVNLLHIYTIYKQKFRRISKEEYQKLLTGNAKMKQTSIDLCKELMKAKQVPDIMDFEKNVGFLSVPRLMPLIALLAERAGYKLKPSLVKSIDFQKTPQRFQDKFAYLMVYGFWFLGRVISDSLSSKEVISRGNMFNFSKGDMGFWWAGVRILDWISFVNKSKLDRKMKDCYSFVQLDPPQYREYSNRAIINMHKHPLYLLSPTDWQNYTTTVQKIRHKRLPRPSLDITSSEDDSLLLTDYGYSNSDISSLSSETSMNTLASRESID